MLTYSTRFIILKSLCVYKRRNYKLQLNKIQFLQFLSRSFKFPLPRSIVEFK